MHYYKRNIGDYHKKAGRLSILEHGAYTLLMDACYDRERFPTKDEAIDWLWARGEDEIKAIEFVLEKFFELQDDGTYVQNRIKEELSAYHAMAETNQRIAREREAKRREARNKKKSGGVNNDDKARSVHEACETVNETPPNQELLTTNHQLLTINQEPVIAFDEFWEAYDKKVDRTKCLAKWEELSEQQHQEIMSNVHAYVAANNVKQYRKNPLTYLNGECWLDEIITSQPTKNNQGLQDAKQSKLNELEQYINSYGTEQEIRHVN